MRKTMLLTLALVLACSPAMPDPKEQALVDAYRNALELLNGDRYEDALEALGKVRAERWSPYVDVAIARSLDGLGRRGLACEMWASLQHDETLEKQKKDGKNAAGEAQARVAGAIADCWKTGFGMPLPMRGAADAAVTILEVAEYQCPYCRKSQATLKQVAEAWPGKVRFAWLSLPLAFHQKARPAALAVAAAQRQGRFWEMHELLMVDVANLEPSKYAELAKQAGLDVAHFTADLADPGIEAFVARNEAVAAALGAIGTPTFFINGTRLDGAQPFAKFQEAIEAALVATAAEALRGTPADRLSDLLAARNNAVYRDAVLRGKVPDKAAAVVTTSRTTFEDTVWNVPVDAGDAAAGPADALVTIVELSDFQCPFCGRVAATMRQVLETYGSTVRFVVKHNPLAFHKDARAAARAAIAAQAQGRFWPMHDKLFENQRDLTPAALSRYAKELGLDAKAFAAAMADPSAEARIAADQALSTNVDATGTPTFFVNGRKLPGAQPFDAFKQIVDEELAKAHKAVAAGTPKEKLYETLIVNGKRN